MSGADGTGHGTARETAGETAGETASEAGRRAGGRALLAILVAAALLAAAQWWFPARGYAILKAAHVVGFVAWMAGLLYLPRLYVYHSDPAVDPRTAATLAVMERRLLKVIMTPAMLATWGLGLWLATAGAWWGAWWLWLKILCVIGLTAAHMHLAAGGRRLAAGTSDRTPRYWRAMNEVPTLLLIAIVTLAVVVKAW